jgi:hypothetical protein
MAEGLLSVRPAKRSGNIRCSSFIGTGSPIGSGEAFTCSNNSKRYAAIANAVSEAVEFYGLLVTVRQPKADISDYRAQKVGYGSDD